MSAATVMYRFAIVASEYNSVITDRLIDGAKRALKAQKEVSLIRVPGCFEIPLAVKQAAASKKYDGIVALGCVLRGETPHFEYIASAVSQGLTSGAAATGVPMAFGVLTTNSIEEAIERAGEGPSNKGWEAAAAAIEMVAGITQLARPERMAIIDRLILRMAVCELRRDADVPRAVVINEALELARTYSTEDAVKFINGMLDAIRKKIDASG